MAKTASAPAGDPDLLSNAVVSPDASLFTREILQAALRDAARTQPPPAWAPDVQALLANVLMNDILNKWNNAGPNELAAARNAANQAGNSALAQHARGLIARADLNGTGALTFFQQAVSSAPGFARAQAQVNNQLVLNNGSATNLVLTQIQTMINQNQNHPALGYFYWVLGRAYFQNKDWSNAIIWLQKSVDVLQTVWYNRWYLATAQNNAGGAANQAVAQLTMQDIINDPRFAKSTLKQIVPSLRANLNNPQPVDEARKAVHDFVQPFFP